MAYIQRAKENKQICSKFIYRHVAYCHRPACLGIQNPCSGSLGLNSGLSLIRGLTACIWPNHTKLNPIKKQLPNQKGESWWNRRTYLLPLPSQLRVNMIRVVSIKGDPGTGFWCCFFGQGDESTLIHWIFTGLLTAKGDTHGRLLAGERAGWSQPARILGKLGTNADYNWASHPWPCPQFCRSLGITKRAPSLLLQA